MLELDNEPQAALDALQATFDWYDQRPFPSAHSQGVLLNDIANMHYKMGRLDLALGVNDRILELQRATGREDSLGFLIVSLNRATLLHTFGEVVAAYESRRALLPRLEELEADAFDAAAALNAATGESDWRLPNLEELTSMVERKCFAPALNLQVFPEVAWQAYWSSTAYNVINTAVTVDFRGGINATAVRTSRNRRRRCGCIRSMPAAGRRPMAINRDIFNSTRPLLAEETSSTSAKTATGATPGAVARPQHSIANSPQTG